MICLLDATEYGHIKSHSLNIYINLHCGAVASCMIHVLFNPSEHSAGCRNVFNISYFYSIVSENVSGLTYSA